MEETKNTFKRAKIESPEEVKTAASSQNSTVEAFSNFSSPQMNTSEPTELLLDILPNKQCTN